MPRRITKNIPEFNGYISTTDTYLGQGSPITNGARLGLSPQNITDWNSKRSYWRDTLYKKYTDPLQSTSAVKEQVRNFISDFQQFGQPLVNFIAANPNAKEADAAIFNFVYKRAKATRRHTAMEELVEFTAQPLGGGDLKFSCRTSHDSARPSKADGADSVQLAFLIVDANLSGRNSIYEFTPSDMDMSEKAFTKAVFTFHAGAVNVGKRMVVFARWWNTKHPELAGPWSAVRMVVIA